MGRNKPLSGVSMWLVVGWCWSVWFSGVVEGKRPELLGSSAWYTNASVLNENFESIVVQMDFDQPLYTNGHSFLCPWSDLPCPDLSCKPCDWSGQEPTGCEDSTCCGPAQQGDTESASAWCASDGPKYETLTVGETSKRFSLAQGERMYVRFFIPEEDYCRSVLVIPRPYFGSVSSSFSTLEAFPSFSTNSGWRNGQNQKAFRYGQSSAIFCPNTNIHPEYNAGTYSGMLYAVVDTSFEIEVLVSPEAHPIPDPSNPLSCGDVPSEVMGSTMSEQPAFCIEEGQTHIFDVDSGYQQAGIVLPVDSGCKTVTIATAIEIPTSATQSTFLFCYPPRTTAPPTTDNVGLFQTGINGQTLSITACFDEPAYLRCTLRLITTQPVHFSFSTSAPVVRKRVTEIPDASLAYMDGFQSSLSMPFGGFKFPCTDFYTVCADWMVTPSDDTLFLFPPPASPQRRAERTFDDLQEFYRNAGLQEIKENRLSFVIVLQMGSTIINTKDINELSVVISDITNEDGEPVNLGGGGLDLNPESTQHYSTSQWMTHIGLPDIPEFEYPPCDTDRYQIYQEIVADRVKAIEQDTDFDEVLGEKYSLDVMNEALLARTCTDQVSDNLDTFVEELFVTDSTECFQVQNSLPFFSDVCCNVFLSILGCCLPREGNITETPYGTTADVSDCGEQECAQSYYEELSFSLNHVTDADLGCTSGITDPTASLGQAMTESIKSQYTNCLVAVGFGDFYEGIFCQIDADCNDYLGVCHEGRCALPSLEKVQEQFLECYIQSMPSSLESYIRRNVLHPLVADYPKNSSDFLNVLLEAATVQDCVNSNNPLAIDHRTRYQTRPLDYACVTENFYELQWPDDFEEVLELCPGAPCLRSFGCLVNTSSCIYDKCNEYIQEYIKVTEEICPTDLTCDVDVDGDCSGSYCVYCPANGDLPCTEVPNFTNEDDCRGGVACELPDGSVSFKFTEEECRQQGKGCSTDCPGNSCESVYLLSGGCFVPFVSSDFDCTLYASTNNIESDWFKDSLCVLPTVLSESDCTQLPSTEWETCQQNELDDCTGGTTQQQFLGCYESLWHACTSEEECEDPLTGGQCSDRDFLAAVRSYDPVDVQYGACINSGEYVSGVTPLCDSIETFSSVAGCVSRTIDRPEDCVASVGLFQLFWWATISLSKDDCVNREIPQTNRGCLIYYDPTDIMLWIFEEEECECKGGELHNTWEWTPGIWRGGVPRDLEWREARTQPFYEFKDSLSFILLAEWVLKSTEEQFLYPLQSQIICESQSITLPVSTLVCDCLGDGGEVCYDPGEEEKELVMGLSEVCEGETNYVKTPSAQVNFGTKSVSDGCSFLDIAIIYQNWFAAPFVPPPLSFRWQETRERGVVINQNGATVGEVVGDGLVLTFSKPSVVEEFDVCLRKSTDSSHDVADFGYSNANLESIYPLGLKKIDIEDRDLGGIWYCSSFDFQEAPASEGTIRLFPINRLENYKEEDDNYTNDTTRALCYTLGALYCLLGVLSFIGVVALIYQAATTRKSVTNLPAFCSTAFVVLCIFRASFMFLYPTGTFEFEPLSYFVVFEIPTFILFSVLVYMIYSFKRLVYKKGFFPGDPTPILIIGWTFVWSMWVVVTIVYSEVILDGSGGSSACEGRVEVSYNDEEEDTRTLSIAYQSVIIAVTLVLTVIFFYYTYQIYKNATKTSRTKQFIIVVGGSFNVAFFVRTILFLIILAADFSSSVYLFCTLFFTEVLMMSFLLLQFNLRYLQSLASSARPSTSSSSRFTRPSSSVYHTDISHETGPQYDLSN